MSAVMIAPAHAEGPYVGLGVSVFDQPEKSGTQASLKFIGGYDFNQTWGVEAGVSAVPFFSAHDGAQGLGEGRGGSMYVAGKATMAINDKWSLVTKLGVAHTRLKFDGVGSSGLNRIDHDNNTGLFAGIGLKYAVTEKFSLSLDLERNGRQRTQMLGGPRAETISLNANYKFR